MNAPFSTNKPRHFLDLSDHDGATLKAIIADAKKRKLARGQKPKGMPDTDQPLNGKVLAMIFDKQSTRTRISFDMAARQLGGSALMLTGNEMVEDLAANATIPVINGLTKWSHPCQVMADVMTYEEHKGSIAGATVCWSGDGNNVLTSWVHAAVKFGFKLNVASPRELTVDQETRDWAAESGLVQFTTDAEAAVEGADCVVTDTWVSMGDDNATKRQNLLKPYQVNADLMARANKGAIFMHCLPAHRGEEVTDEVIDGPQSVVFDEAENRLHAQKAILAWALA
jgi:ornithine carbamoyltransferase